MKKKAPKKRSHEKVASKPVAKPRKVAPPVAKPAPKGKRHEKRDLARVVFFSGTRTAKEIAELLDVSEQSISKWRQEENWDEQKEVFNTTTSSLIKEFTSDLVMLRKSFVDEHGERRVPSTKEVDQINKLTKSIKYLRNQLDPQTIMEALDGFMAYLADVDLDLAKRMAPRSIAYVQMRMSESKQK